MLFFLLMNVQMPTIVGILTFMSKKKFILSWVEHDFLRTSGPGQWSQIKTEKGFTYWKPLNKKKKKVQIVVCQIQHWQNVFWSKHANIRMRFDLSIQTSRCLLIWACKHQDVFWAQHAIAWCVLAQIRPHLFNSGLDYLSTVWQDLYVHMYVWACAVKICISLITDFFHDAVCNIRYS